MVLLNTIDFSRFVMVQQLLLNFVREPHIYCEHVLRVEVRSQENKVMV